MRCCALFLVAGLSMAQDPANGWMAYAVGKVPEGVERITRLEMTWKVGASPRRGNAFFSPWFGMDPSDNDNLIQPVNPWVGDGWEMYTEYFQWRPEHNSNSAQHSVQSGQTLHGSLVYDASSDAYTLTQEILETGQKSTQVVPCQSDKKFTIPYVVYEKAFPCAYYPPDEIVTFTDIVAECDGKDCASQIEWSAKNYDDRHCDMQAHIAPGNQNISITWDTSAVSKLDGLSDAALYDLNTKHGGWATALNITRPL